MAASINRIVITRKVLKLWLFDQYVWLMPWSFSSCNRCGADLSTYQSFYTIAKNGMMYGFFCSHDCASLSEVNRYLQAYIVKVNAAPATHKELVVIPDVKVLKQYQEELEKRKLWKKYLS